MAQVVGCCCSAMQWQLLQLFWNLFFITAFPCRQCRRRAHAVGGYLCERAYLPGCERMKAMIHSSSVRRPDQQRRDRPSDGRRKKKSPSASFDCRHSTEIERKKEQRSKEREKYVERKAAFALYSLPRSVFLISYSYWPSCTRCPLSFFPFEFFYPL